MNTSNANVLSALELDALTELVNLGCRPGRGEPA